jgi:hypothetical protein
MFLHHLSPTPSHHKISKYLFPKKAFLCEKKLRNFNNFEKYFEFKFRVFSLGFHVLTPARPTPHPFPDKLLKKTF